MLVLEARPQLGGRATAFTDRVTGELVDNGQHVLFGCYTQTFAFLSPHRAEGHVRRQAALTGAVPGSVGNRSVLQCPSLPPPLHLLGAVLTWPPMSWRDRLSVLRLAPSLQAARRELARTGTLTIDGEVTVSRLAARARADRETDGLAVGAAGARGAQSVARRSAGDAVRARARRDVRPRSRRRRRSRCRCARCTRCTPSRRAPSSRRRGGEVRTGALARVVTDGTRVTGVDVRGERIATARVIAAVPWFGMRTLFARCRFAGAGQARGGCRARWASKPIVTVNLWYDRRVMEEPFVGLPGRVDAVGLRQTADVRSRDLALVARGERRRRADGRAHGRPRRARRARGGRGNPRRARRDARPRHRDPGEARDVLARRRPARASTDRAPASTVCGSPATGLIRDCQERLRARW